MEAPKKESYSNTESYTLKLKNKELIKIDEELKKAKENATQSWLDSRPLIDELEKRKSSLEVSKKRASMSENLVSELEAELETTNAKINSTKEEEIKAMKMVSEINQVLDQLREEMEGVKCFAGEKRQKKLKLKRVLRQRRQRLRSLQLRIEAVQREAEACRESGEEAVRYLNVYVENEGVDADQIQLSHEEYMTLKKRVDEKNSLADWRVSVAAEQTMEAETNRNLAKAKLRELKVGKRVKRLWEVREREGDENVEDGERDMVEEENDNREVVAVIPVAQPKKEDFGLGSDPVRRSAKRSAKATKKKKKKKKMAKGKKRSIFWQMKQCFLFNLIGRLFK
ncbi:hypothetical protein TIFTF001_002640 [Ficus carica]|uniref:Uncharacterized protein n=1 Tax=Ficus carica TaxID=3494 RepID=A0AA87ZNU9_FICCA|nr:hypothetical protein TIFTF001_002640 [Ficus carica]